MSPLPLEIAAEVTGLDDADPDRVHRIRGQVAVATTVGRVESVSLVPAGAAGLPGGGGRGRRPPTWSCSAPGPGSPACCRTCWCPTCSTRWSRTAARRVVALNLAAQPGETAGFSPQQHLEVLAAHAPRLRVDAVVADTDAVSDAHGLMSGVSALGARLVLAPVAAGDGTARHDPGRLAAAYGTVLEELPAVVEQAAGRVSDGGREAGIRQWR